MTLDEMCREYDLSTEDIRAAIKYAEELVEQKNPLPAPHGLMSSVRFFEGRRFSPFHQNLLEKFGHEAIDRLLDNSTFPPGSNLIFLLRSNREQ